MNTYFNKIKLICTLTFSLLFGSIAAGDNAFNKMADNIVKKFNAPAIKIEALKNKISSKEYILLDARELNEFNISHIPTARHIGYEEFNSKLLAKSIPKTAKIVVYCSVGYRSGKIADKLVKLGYNTSNLHGGIFSWVNKGNVVVNKNGKVTKKIHGYNKSWSKWITGKEIVY